MKKQTFRSALLISVFLGLAGPWAHATELTKEFHEEYKADASTVLTLMNKYGNIDVQNWENPRIKIDVVVTVKHSNPERAEKMLSYINVAFSSSGNSVKAETQIDEKFSRSSNWSNGNDFEINYTVQMPAKINLDLFNKYGHVIIDEVDGLANIDLKYGKLTVNKLGRGDEKPLNTVNLAYANGSSITECSWLKANIKYSGLDIEKAKAIVAYTSYMKLNVGEVSSVVIEGKYDGYTFGNLANLVLNTSYSSVKINELSEKLEVQSRYTNVNVESVPAGFDEISIDSKYGTFRIGIDENASYKLDGEASYAKIYYHDTGKVSKIQENTSMKVNGNVGTQANPTAEVKVLTRYGNVKLDD